MRRRHTPAVQPAGHPVLLVTSGDDLRADAERIAATVGVPLRVATQWVDVGDAWASAPLVLVTAAALQTPGSRGRVARRPAVVVLDHAAPDAATLQAALALGADEVLPLPGAADRLAERLADSVDGAAASVLCLVGASGGAGTTTLALGVATAAAASGRRVALIDLDPLSGGIDLTVGAEHARGVRWPDLRSLEGRVVGESLVSALVRHDGVALLACGRPQPEASAIGLPDDEPVAAVVAAIRRATDLVVVDAARAVGDPGGVVASATHLGLVVPADVRGCVAGVLAHARVMSASRIDGCVVRTGRGRSLPAIEVAESVGLPLWAELPDDGSVVDAAERADGPSIAERSTFGRAVRALLDQFDGARTVAA